MIQSDAPIGVFDSGVGGISVLRELARLMPRENLLYFGDSANAPYGPRPTEDVLRLTMTNARSLFDQGCKALVVACNTATTAAILALRRQYPDRPIIGIEPALKPAVLNHDHPRVLVLATEGTLREQKFADLMAQYREQAEILPQPAPGIVEFVEQGITGGPQLEAYLRQLLAPYTQEKVDAVVLGCTHFPFARGAILNVLHYPVSVYDGAPGTARQTRRLLEEAGLLSLRSDPGVIRLTNSKPELIPLSEQLLHMELT